MLRANTIFAACLAGLAGCSSVSDKSGDPGSLDWEDAELSATVPATPATPPSARSPAPVVETNQITEITGTWVSLRRWNHENGLASPLQFSSAPDAAFAIHTPQGTFVIRSGTTSASWKGLELRLGFAPMLVEGELHLHALDIAKNLRPLVLDNSNPVKTSGVIVIDPGHGGENSGARSAANQRWEKEFTLDWALRLAPLLDEGGWTVFLTRTNDADVSLMERVALAGEKQADLFISLHFNSAGGGTQTGIETFCVTPVGMPSTLVRNGPDEPALVLPNNAFDEANLLYAFRVHESLMKHKLAPDRGVRRARFMTVLRYQNRPAVLVEGGFLSNPAEAARIAAPEHRQKLAEAVAAALTPENALPSESTATESTATGQDK